MWICQYSCGMLDAKQAAKATSHNLGLPFSSSIAKEVVMICKWHEVPVGTAWELQHRTICESLTAKIKHGIKENKGSITNVFEHTRSSSSSRSSTVLRLSSSSAPDPENGMDTGSLVSHGAWRCRDILGSPAAPHLQHTPKSFGADSCSLHLRVS